MRRSAFRSFALLPCMPAAAVAPDGLRTYCVHVQRYALPAFSTYLLTPAPPTAADQGSMRQIDLELEHQPAPSPTLGRAPAAEPAGPPTAGGGGAAADAGASSDDFEGEDSEEGSEEDSEEEDEEAGSGSDHEFGWVCCTLGRLAGM